MNENVTIKTPKRRRWIARLLVSALCILLASSLLFVGVSAENIVLTAQFSGNYYVSASSVDFISFIDADTFYYFGDDYLRYQDGDIVVGSRGSVWSDTNSSCYGDGNIYISSFAHLGSAMRWSLYTVGLSSFDSISYVNHDFASSTSSVTYLGSSSAYSSGTVYAFVFYKIGSDISVRVVSSTSGVLSTGYRLYLPSDFYFTSSMRTSSFVYGDFLVNLGANICFNLSTKQFVSLSDFGLPSSFSAFVYDGALYALTSDSILMCDDYTFSFRNVGSFGFAPLAVYVDSGVVTAASSFSAFNLNYTIFTGIDGSPAPPESSDETTTDPPPESSEESSEPDVTLTKIWKYEPGSDGTSVSIAIGEVDLNDAVKVEAFLGRFESSLDNSDWTDSPQNLMLRVTNSDDTEDIYQFDFPAFGYYSGLLSSEVEFSDFVFPGFVGYWFEIPFENGSEISFATKSPGGSVFLYGYNMQLTVNFNSPDSSFRLLFGQDSYSVVLSNIGENSQIVVFEDETVLRYKKFTVNGGSSWYAPEEGTFALFPASDVLDPNILLSSIRIETNVDNTLGFPTESFLESVSKWEEYLSRQEDKQDFLNSLAGDAYDQISIDPDTSEAYGDAVDTFSTIVNSEGGSVIFGFFRYMWSVHPLMSSMASLVVTFAIVGFVVRRV